MPQHPISARISPQHRISQAYSDDRQLVATANDGVNSIKQADEHSLAALLAALPRGHPQSEPAADIPSAKSRNTSARSAKSGPPRVGAVKCVPRPASASGTRTSTPARPQSAAGLVFVLACLLPPVFANDPHVHAGEDADVARCVR
jgi:hypothetical protein